MKSFVRRHVRLAGGSGLLSLLTLAVCFLYQPFATVAASPSINSERDLQSQWKHVAMIGADTRAAGWLPGGEGGQWIRTLGWSHADPDFLIMGTDVGGLFRSLDGGESWQITMAGYNARGANAVALDPRNADRVLIAAANSTDYDAGRKVHGLYLSTNKAGSWKQVLPMSEGQDDRDSVAYDPSSYDPNLGYCTVAYFVSKYNGIYKSIDGGLTWNQINTGYSGLLLRVHPTKGYLYLISTQDPNDPNTQTPAGFYRSTDGGLTFTNTLAAPTFGADVSPAAPDSVWITHHDEVLVSHDSGLTFQAIQSQNLPPCCTQPLLDLNVSPVNPNYMVTWWPGDNWDWRRIYTTDGGKTWGVSDYGHYNDNFRLTKNELLPYNVRNGVWAYSPVNANVLVSTGGDWVTKSKDGGANFTWSNDGNNGVFVPSFNFSPSHPDSVLIATKDYNSYYTNNGGRTWAYAETGFDFGGYGFGGFALDSQVMWLGNDKTYSSQGPAYLKQTSDGGKTWTYKQYNGEDIALADNGHKWDLISSGDPTDPNIAYIGGWRTTDHGQTWAPMTGVEDVYVANPQGQHELYGKSGEDIVVSYDHGASWQKVVTVPGGFRELAYDHLHNRFWIATATLINGQSELKKYENGQLTTVSIPGNQYGGTRVAAVAVDPGNPNIVYVGNDYNLWVGTNAVLRSVDGGQTWQNLTVETPLKNGDVSVSTGPREIWWIEVNPKTHEAWVSTNCFGVWKIAAPK